MRLALVTAGVCGLYMKQRFVQRHDYFSVTKGLEDAAAFKENLKIIVMLLRPSLRQATVERVAL